MGGLRPPRLSVSTAVLTDGEEEKARQRLGRWETNRSEESGETAVGNGVIMGVGTCTGLSETTTTRFHGYPALGGGYVFTSS